MKLFLAAHRLPVSLSYHQGNILRKESDGGLATALRNLQRMDHLGSRIDEVVTVGIPQNWPSKRDRTKITFAYRAEGLLPAYVPKTLLQEFYQGVCNGTLWPLCHYMSMLTQCKEESWNSYQQVNELVAKTIAEEATENDLFWIHDYHLMLVPGLIRQKFPDARIGFFLHIPFPSFEMFRLLPARWRSEIMHGLLSSDIVGFHTLDYVQHFVRTARRFGGLESEFNTIEYDGRSVQLKVQPLGIDVAEFTKIASEPRITQESRKLKESIGAQKVMISIDRLDYIKGIQHKIDGFRLFLKSHPDWRNRVTMALTIVPSRDQLFHYRSLKERINHQISELNGEFGTTAWTPIVYQYRSIDKENLVSHYLAGDVLLVTSLRDGMNLVAKEYLASKRGQPGVLILSEFAGASIELSDALQINPNSDEEISQAIYQALSMPESEQCERNGRMYQALASSDSSSWAMSAAKDILSAKRSSTPYPAATPTEEIVQQIAKARSSGCTIVLDYDGTLVPFHGKPWEARPDGELLSLLSRVCRETNLHVLIATGRTRDQIANWLSLPGLDFLTDQGSWVRVGMQWAKLTNQPISFLKNVIPSIESTFKNIVGVVIEQKRDSLAIHFREVTSLWARQRVMELSDNLSQLLVNSGAELRRGAEVLEIVPTVVSKGLGLHHYFGATNRSPLLIMGDEKTDESMFKAFPDSISVLVGNNASAAMYQVPCWRTARKILSQLTSALQK